MTCSDPEDYKCPGEARCLPPHWLCDGDNDCQDSSDELEANCSKSDITHLCRLHVF